MDDPERWADLSGRMTDCRSALDAWPKDRPMDLAFAATLIRCAYAAGYSDAHADPMPVPLEEARVAEARFRLALP